MKAYFGTFPYLASESHQLDYQSTNQAFIDRKSAVILGNGETVASILKNSPSELSSRLAAALPFGVPWWEVPTWWCGQTAAMQHAAVHLVRFLLENRAQSVYPKCMNYLPVRAEVLQSAPYTTDPILKNLADAVRTGRIFPITRLSGLLEEHLGNALVNI